MFYGKIENNPANENRLEKIKKIFISALLNPNSWFFEFVIYPQ